MLRKVLRKADDELKILAGIDVSWCDHRRYMRLISYYGQLIGLIYLFVLVILKFIYMDYTDCQEYILTILLSAVALFMACDTMHLKFVSVNFGFMKDYFGRGVFYFFISGFLLQESQVLIPSKILGFYYLCFVLFMIVSYFVEREDKCMKPQEQKEETSDDEDIDHTKMKKRTNKKYEYTYTASQADLKQLEGGEKMRK